MSINRDIINLTEQTQNTGITLKEVNNLHKFRPVRCTEEALRKMSHIDGSVYFTTDTQKIFMSQSDSLIQMCESKGFYYGTKEIIYDDSGNEPDPNVDFFLEEIEGGKLPEKDDLILNTDGCFYRVLSIIGTDSVATVRLTLQGSGGGSSGGGGGTVNGSFAIYAPGGRTKYFSSDATEAIIDVAARSSDASNFIVSVELSFDSTFVTTIYAKYDLSYALETAYVINLAPYLNQFNEYAKLLWIRVTDKYGNERTQYYTISLASLKLMSNHNSLFDVYENINNGNFDYTCSISGTTGITNRIIYYKVYNSENVEKELGFYELNNTQTNATKTLGTTELEHGSYTFTVQAIGYIGGNKISSNILSYKLVKYDPDYGSPILSALFPTSAQQYVDISVPYLLTYGTDADTYKLVINVNDTLETELDVVPGQIFNYSFNFDFTGTYTIDFIIEDLGISESYVLTITKYAGDLPVIKIDEDDLKVYLTAKKRTNTASNKNKWPDYKNPLKEGDLYDFYYKNVNGWLTDETGTKCLIVNQGASVEYKEYYPFSAANPKTTGLTIELDFKVSGILDYSESARLIECLSYYNDGTIYSGFYVTGNSFNYYASGNSIVQIDLVEGKRIRLAFVIEQSSTQEFPMCFTYLNGHMCGAKNYYSTDIFTDAQIPAYFKINSNYGEVALYNFRIYNTAHNSQSILYNYQADLSPLEVRQKNYNDNLIYDDNGNISLTKIEQSRAAGTYRLNIPYVKITGGYLAANNKDMTMSDNTTEVRLPKGKKDYRSIDIEIYYPTKEENSYFVNYPASFKSITTFDDPNLNVLNGFGQTPNTAAVMYAQGTSSLEYPVKNLRVKFKGSAIKVHQNLAPVDLICFKADYMDSSGSHNTGASNFIDKAYDAIGIETPGQKHFNTAQERIVTCIKGHPCIIFYSPNGIDYEYIGKYNLNLDKATPEPFGFRNDDTNFGYETDIEGNLILDENGNKKNSIYCFEFLDNAVPVCNFKSRSGVNGDNEVEKYYHTWYDNFTTAGVSDKDEVTGAAPGWTFGFESRYPEDKKGKNDADVLYELANWLNELYDLRYNQGKEEEALWRFKDEYQLYLDKDFTVAYYCITETLLMADSRVKNMMIATWGPEHRTITRYPEQGNFEVSQKEEIFRYIWYPIFYDMDTMLGLDNTGVRNKEWYAEDTVEGTFNGDEILWKFVRDALPAEIAAMYNALESSEQMFTLNGILPYFNVNQANMANEVMYTEDAYYKYINPFRNGYQDELNNKYIAPGTGTRLYAVQGDRSMMREYFLINRLRFLRGKYSSQTYLNGDRIEFRVSSPDRGESDIIDATLDAVPPSGTFNLTSLQTGYAGVKIGQNGVPINVRFDGKTDATIVLSDQEYKDASATEAYLLGASNLSDLGDLSNKYLQNFVIAAEQNKLEKIKLGNENRNYYNPNWTKAQLTLGSCQYLKEFDFRNCGNYTEALDFSRCPQLQTILMTGSKASSAILPISGVISELRLPTTVSTFSIESHPLKDEGFTIGSYNYDTESYENDFSLLSNIKIVSTNIDSYNILKGALRLNSDESNSRLLSVCVQDFNWKITDREDFEIITTEDGKEKIVGIKVLDKIKNINVFNQDDGAIIPVENKLIGNIEVDVIGQNLLIDEYELYETYYAIYPNVTIKSKSDLIIEAYTIDFYNSYNGISGKPYYSVKSSGSQNLAWLISADGPNKEILANPNRKPDVDKIWNFSGIWTLANGTLLKANDMSIAYEKGATVSQEEFVNLVPGSNVSFTANYISEVRTYTILLVDDDDNGNKELLRASLPWNADIGIELSKIENGYRTTYNYKEYKGTNEHYRWAFKGWQSDYDRNNSATEPTYKTLNGLKVNGNFIAYAFYKEEDSTKIATNQDYFICQYDDSYIVNNEKYFGYVLTLKSLYKDVIQGKVTVPSVYVLENGETVTISFLNGFADATKITDVYFLDNNQYQGLYGSCFAMSKNNALTNVFLPNKTNTFKFLDERAFMNCNNLQSIDIDNNGILNPNIVYIGSHCFGYNSTAGGSSLSSKSIPVKINGLPKNLIFLSGSAFYNGESNTSVNIRILPEGLKILKAWTFNNCINVNIEDFGNSDSTKGLHTIESGALYNAGSEVGTIYINASITNISSTDNFGMAAFTSYARNTLNKIVFYKSIDTIANLNGEYPYTRDTLGLMGITVTNIEEIL